MIDALLFAVRDGIRNAGYGWDVKTCEIMADGHPPARCGDWFAAVHEGDVRNEVMNYLDEYLSYSVTITRRVTIALDRLGDQLVCSKLARTLAKETGFNARCEQMRAFLHMNWGILQDANTNIVQMFVNVGGNVNGFAEPAHYIGKEIVSLQGPEWVGAAPIEPGEALRDIAIKSELRFEGARRLQPIATFR